ncbi:MAG: signal peptidase II [Clostridia bacterium]|nr:signal peptidase II [Clostridia bacterium]MBR1683696.1 signal peptidase II [Clostridia bacterium]MBR2287673.1 signal peptidase II [Clostridia bacterium]
MIWIAVMVVVLDRVTKLLTPPGTAFSLLPGILGIRYAENTGMAFSLLSGRPWLLGLLSLLVITIGFLVLKRYRLSRIARIAAMLMLGGGVGNMLDRFFTGFVVDMIELEFVRFAIFNVADAALTVGTVMMAACLLLDKNAFERK